MFLAGIQANSELPPNKNIRGGRLKIIADSDTVKWFISTA